MHLTVLGSSATYPGPGRPASGYMVETDSVRILLDCGPGVFVQLLERAVVPDAIVLTHGHGDHCLDILPMFNYFRFGRGDVSGIPLLAPQGVVDRLSQFIGARADHAFFDVFSPLVVAAGEEHVMGDTTVKLGAAVHPVPAVCVKLEVPGSSLVYSGDTGPGGDLVELSSGSELLLCEATHQGPIPSDRYPYHLYAIEAGTVAATAGVGRLLVTHVGSTLDPAASVGEAAAVFDGRVDHAVPNMEVEL